VGGASIEGVQFGFALGKHLGGAVQRNRLRRQLRAIAVDVAEDAAPGAYLVSARSEAIGLPSEQLRKAMTEAVQRASSRQETHSSGFRSRGGTP
jgi:ribonuclease P protein component